MVKISVISLLLLILLLWSAQSKAQSFKQTQFTIANGTDSAFSTTFKSKATIGQNILGLASSANFEANQGFEFTTSSGKTVDLTIENLVIDPASVGPGNDITLSFDIKNQGDGTVAGGSFGIGVYLSNDQTIDPNEDLVTISISSDIGPAETYNFPQTGDNDDVTISSGTSSGDYFIILRADNGDEITETDETNNEISTALTVTSDSNPPVLANFTTATYFSTGSTVSVSVTDNVGVDRVNFYHRGLTTPGSQGWGSPVEVTSTTGVYSVELESGWLDDQGVEYWFEAFDASNNRDSTGLGYTYFQTVGGELNYPGLKKGRRVSDYEIISVPFDLTNKGPRTIFSAFGPYDPKEWRMYQYTGGSTKEFEQGWTTMDLGKSYWIINDVAGAGTIQIGEGRAPMSNKQSPYTINLVQGWNQIGNPYRFDVSWNDIMTASGDPTEVERFRIWSNGNFSDGTTLSEFGGGFVFTSGPVTISVPITPPASSATEQTAARLKKLTNPIDSDNWEVNFLLTNEEMKFIYGGFGMREDASVSKDNYDEVGSPRFVIFLEMNFDHPEYFIPRFSKDIIPPASQHQWEFVVESNSEYKQTTLSWDNSYFGDNDRQLYLFDDVKQRYINMRDVDQYTFTVHGTYKFKVFYGNADYIENELQPNRVLLGNNYPNPFVNNTVIPFTLPQAEGSYEVELKVFNQLGKEVNKLLKGTYGEGFYEIEWNGNNRYGQRVPPGIYLYQLIVDNNERRVIQTGKMAVN